MAKETIEKPTLEEIRKTSLVEPSRCGHFEMVTVRCRKDGVRDNGNTYQCGDLLRMELGLVGAHVAAGQVELVAKKDLKAAPAGKDSK